MSPLEEYIEKCRASGIEDEKIKQELHVSGYTSQMIDQAFDHKLKSTSKKKLPLAKLAVITAPYILAVAVFSYAGYYFLVPKSNTKTKLSITALKDQENSLSNSSNANVAEEKLKLESFSFGNISTTSAITVSPQKTKIIITQTGNTTREIRSALGNCTVCSEYAPWEVYFDENDEFMGTVYKKGGFIQYDYLKQGKVSSNFLELPTIHQ